MKFAALLFSLAALASAADYQISGIVVDHLTNRPLNHVLVQITKVGKQGGDASVLTEADGRFTFTHVPPGKYQLSAEKRGEIPEGFNADGGYSTAIVVDGKEKTDGIVFKMRTDASISGIVLSDDGEPVPNAQIDLFKEAVTDGEAQVVQLRGGRTNSSGQFHMGHLEAGNYYVSVEAVPWFATPSMNLVYPVTFYGDVTDADSAKVITLPEGGSASLQINMHTVPGIHVKLGDQARGVGIFAPGPGGTRIPVPAVFNAVGPGTVRHHNGLIVSKAPEQNVELTNLAAGRYEVMKFGGEGGQGQSLQTMDLADGSTITFDEIPPVAISGSVLIDGKRPGGDMEVYLNSTQHGGMMADVKADGTFKFARASTGRYQVHLNTPDLTVSSVAVKGARLLHDEVEIAPGASVELTIRAAQSEALATVEGVAIRGKAGFAGAMVLLVPQDLGQTRLIRRDQSDEDGSFSLAGVLPGRYTLVAIDDGKDLAFKSDAVIKPYLAAGVSVTIPVKNKEPVTVPVQTRLR